MKTIYKDISIIEKMLNIEAERDKIKIKHSWK